MGLWGLSLDSGCVVAHSDITVIWLTPTSG